MSITTSGEAIAERYIRRDQRGISLRDVIMVLTFLAAIAGAVVKQSNDYARLEQKVDSLTDDVRYMKQVIIQKGLSSR